MKGRNQTFISWRFPCLLFIIILLLATNIPATHQIRDSQDQGNNLLDDHVNVETPEGSPASMAPKPSAGLSDERLDLGSCGGPGSTSPFPVHLRIQHDYVTINNGLIEVTLSKPGGFVTGINYNGMDNVLEWRYHPENRGYWDLNWGKHYSSIRGTHFRVIKEDENQVELSFLTTWDASMHGIFVPLNIDKRYIVMRGCSGFYAYAIYERLAGWPGFDLSQTRIAFKLLKDKFHYMAISDDRRRVMPTPEDRIRGQVLDYKEAVLLTTGEVDDKYQYSSEDQDLKVHGWISSDPNVGFWIITPSDEFRTGGPLKQELTSHVGPTALAMFGSCHYTGTDLEMKFEEGEAWKKVMGPVLIYLNSASDDIEDPRTALWEDAKHQMMMEVESWPYSFPVSEDFPKSSQRGSVNGRLLVHNRFSNLEYVWASNAYVGLAPPGDAGSWQRESKGYQFWTRADANGSFSIRNVRAGDYNLFAWVPGFIGDYRYNFSLTINPGSDSNLGVLIYEPPRDGPTIWEIGFPDRSAAEFFIPNPNPKYINRLYLDHIDSDGRTVKSPDRFRQYGLWERYTDLYPTEDLIYRIGVNDYRKDWFFAQPTRKLGNNSFQETTWQIKFRLENVDYLGTYKLRIALAAASYAKLQVRINDGNARRPQFMTGRIGQDNAIARHGNHGLYWLFNIDVSSYRLLQGENTIFLTQAKGDTPFEGFMYDYVRLEGPSTL